MRRVDPLLLLTLAGLAGSGLLATLYPETTLDAEHPERQAGRRVRVSLLVTDASEGEAWWRGESLPLVADADGTTGYGGGRPIPWMWFRAPPDGVVPGDRIDGRALVQRDSGGVALVLDGPTAATITAGDTAVPIRWDDLIHSPENLEGRVVLLLARFRDEALLSPDASLTCALAPSGTIFEETHELRLWRVRIERTEAAPGWWCRPQGPSA